MKKIWMRVGMEVKLDDLDYESFIHDTNINNISDFIENYMVPNGILSGETYLPSKDNCGTDNYDNPKEEISVLF